MMASSQWWSFLNVSSVLVGLSVFLVVFWLFRRPRNLPPGPRGWPFLGYLPQLAMSSDEPHEVFSKLTARYGNIVCVNVAGTLIVALHGTSLIKEAFAKYEFSGRPIPHLLLKVTRNPGKGIILTSGSDWSEIRRFSLSLLKGLGIGKSSFEEQIVTEVKCLIDEMMKTKEVPFDPKHLLNNAVSNIICSVVFGKRFQYTDANFQNILHSIHEVMESAGAGAVFEFSSFMSKLTFLPAVKNYMEKIRRVHTNMKRMVQDHNEEYDANNPRDFIDALLDEITKRQDQGDEDTALNAVNVHRITTDLFIAGSDTTTTTLRWGLLHLMANPDVQVRIQRELDGVTSRNRFPRLSDKHNLPYTQAALYEIQRIGTIAPFAIPHVCDEDATLNGYNIPKGSIVLSNLWHNHFDSFLWKEPQRFCPERFLDKDGKLKSSEDLIPFGTGRRVCLGEHLAKMEIFVFFTLLMHQFTFKKPDDTPPLSFKGINGSTLSPKGYKVCVIPRE